MSELKRKAVTLPETFKDASRQSPSQNQSRKTTPFCIRLTDEERAYLEELAGSQPLGAFIRQTLLGQRMRKRRTLRKPQIEQTQYASLLAALGQSHLSSNLNQLARHANVGTLDVSQDIEEQLQDACSAVLIMRETLLMALGLKTRAGK